MKEWAVDHTASQKPGKDAHARILMINCKCIPLPISLPPLMAIVTKQIVNKNRNSQTLGVKVG